MFVRIEFKESQIKNYASEEDYRNFIKDKTIPNKRRVNIFTRQEIEKLNNIFDQAVELKEVKIHCLENEELFKKEWFYGDDAKQKEMKYAEAYNASDGINLYLVKSNETYVVDSELLFFLVDSFETKVIYSVTGTLKDIPSFNKSAETRVLEKLLSLEEKISIFDKTQQFNTKVGVHISDLGLLNVKEVDVLCDSCTDILQDWLNEGWRILAICPQPDSRRPDYILGRNERMETRERRSANCR